MAKWEENQAARMVIVVVVLYRNRNHNRINSGLVVTPRNFRQLLVRVTRDAWCRFRVLPDYKYMILRESVMIPIQTVARVGYFYYSREAR
jgi:hypothetical protein